MSSSLAVRLAAFLTCALVLAAGPRAEAYEIHVNPSGSISGLSASDTVILANTAELFSTEIAQGWRWSIFCAGCIVTGWTYNEVPASPPYTPPGLVNWFNTAIAQPSPGLPNGLGTATLTAIGTFLVSGAATAGGISTTGWVTVHVTASSGSIATGYSAGEGIYTCDPSCVTLTDPASLNSMSWVPEPSTATLLLIGLVGFGAMGRRGRRSDTTSH